MLVDRTSDIRSLSSEEDVDVAAPGNANNNTYLEQVTPSAFPDGNEGDVFIGNNASRSVRALNGLNDVQTLDASGYGGNVNVGVDVDDFTSALVSSYFERLEGDETADFSYVTGSGAATLSVQIANTVASHPDFRGTIETGASDGPANLVGANFALQNVSIDGAGGSNTLETSSSINTTAAPTPALFDNIDSAILAGGNANTNAGMDDLLGGIETLIVATDGTANGGHELADPERRCRSDGEHRWVQPAEDPAV